MTHTITWDHSECDHDPDPAEAWCLPDRAEVKCDDPQCIHRLSPDAPAGQHDVYEDGWVLCAGGDKCTEVDSLDEYYGRVAHTDPGKPHTTYGHPLVDTGDCMAAVALTEDRYLTECVRQYRDGPIEVEWDSGYHISYIDNDQRNAVGYVYDQHP